MLLEKGRPSDISGRTDVEIRTYDFLDSLNIEYERVDHQPAMTMEVCAEIEKILGAPICKNLFLCPRNKSKYYLLMMPGDKPFKTKDISAQIGSSRLSFGDEESMMQMLGVTPGSVSVLALMNDKEHQVELIIDEDLLKDRYIGCHPCMNTSSLRIKTADITEKILSELSYTPTFVKL